MEPIKILYVEDDKFDQRNFERLIKQEELAYQYTLAESVAQAKQILTNQIFDVALVDYLLTDGTGLELFDGFGRTPIIMVTGSGDEEIAVRAMKAGACDYLIKDPERNYLKILPITVTKAIKQKQTEDTLRFIQMAQSQHLGYALVNDQLIVRLNNAMLSEWVKDNSNEIIGQHLCHIFPDLNGAEARLLALLRQPTGKLRVNKISFTKANGSVHYYDLQIEPYFHEQNYLLVIVIDTTETVRLEQSLRQERNELKLQIAAREKAEAALQKANAELEQRVIERTRELSEMNARLKQEIAEREQVEKSLRESELRFRTMFENAPVGMSMIDSNYRFVKVNRKMCQTTGYTEAELLQKTFVSITHLQDVDQDVGLAQQVFRGARPYYHIEKRFITKQQTPIWVNMFMAALPNQYGQSKYVLGMVEDITQRKDSQNQLQYQANLLNDVSDAIVSTDINFLIRSWNRAAEQMYGYKAAEVLGQPFTEVIKIIRYSHTSEEDSMMTLRHYGSWRGEIVVQHQDGRVITVLAAVSTIRDNENKPQGYVALHTDITERIKAEEALKESEAKFRSLTQNSPNVIYILDVLSNKITFLNHDLLGYTLQDFAGLEQNIMSRIHPDDFALMEQRQQLIFNGTETILPFEYRLLSKAGQWEWLRCRLTILSRDAQGNPNQLLGTLTIITTLKRIELALQESEERYRLISELTSDYAYALKIEPDGQVVVEWTTQALQRITGSSGIALFNEEGWFKIIHIDDAPLMRERTKRLMSAQVESDVLEFRIYNHIGEIRWLRDHAHSIWDEAEGRVVQIYGAAQDITARKQAQLSLTESEERLRTVIENMPVLMQAVDEQFNIVMWNGEAERISGYKSSDIVNNPNAFTRLYPIAEYRHLVLQEMKNRAGNYRELEFTLTNKLDDQRTIAWSDISSQIHIPGWAYWMVGVDVTERKWMEASLEEERAMLERKVHERTSELRRTNAELAKAIQVKDEFLANMSHELRTPLNTILTMNEMLLKQAIGTLNDKQIDYVQNIAQSGHYLLNMVNDVLDLSEIEAGKLKLEFALVPVQATCQTCLDMVQPAIVKKNLTLITQFDKAVEFMQADAHRLKQILINLLTNAVKFTAAGGQIGLTVEGDRSNQQVMFTVWDTGIGISKANISEIFQLFVQLDSGLNRQQEGIGLGLAISRRLATLHGGTITVESELGQGSRFTVTIPWSESQLPAAAPTALTPQPPKRTKPIILLAEDNESNISVLSDYLTICGYEMVIARNGLEAINMTQSDLPDLILMDIQMPTLSGLEAILRLRAIPKFNNTPIIALTALSVPEHEQCLEAGANTCLSKPIGLHELLAVVEKYIAAKSS